jgi:hypothetical protein
MAGEMSRRLGAGDVPLNLVVTSLVANAWLYDHDQRYAAFVTSYVEAWSDRARGNGGLIPTTSARPASSGRCTTVAGTADTTAGPGPTECPAWWRPRSSAP